LARQRKIGSIEIAQDLAFQRRSWTVQRIGWAAMVLISVAALFGLCGGGPLSSARLGPAGSPLRADYERFLRLDAPAKLTLYVGAAAIRPDSTAEVWLDRAWLADMEVRSITPEPEQTITSAGRVVYTFRLDPSSTAARITYRLVTHSLGPVTGRVGLSNGPSYSFSQFSYP
jgi:hypothetical protein